MTAVARVTAPAAARAFPLARAAAAGPAFVAFVVAALTFAQGGYFPTAWGWSALAFGWVAIVAALLRPAFGLGRLDLAQLGLLGAFVGWTALSALWSSSTTQTALETERLLVYPLALAAFVLVARRRSVPLLAGCLLAVASAVVGWGVLTRLLPDRIGVFDAVAGYRLASPVDYWNALGLVAAMGLSLALALSARGRTAAGRAAAAATLPVLACGLYFTFSRGAWLALAAGGIAAVAYDRRRLQLVAAAGCAALPAAAAVVLASRAHGLGDRTALLADAAHDGHRFLLELAVAAAASAVLAAAFERAERRIKPQQSVRVAWASLLGVAVIGAVATGIAHYGSPLNAGTRAYNAFVRERASGDAHLQNRLFSFSGNGRAQIWHAAWEDASAHPVLGSGAATFEVWWLDHRTLAIKVRDAHSVYLEALAELGPLGLALLAAALAVPLVAARRARDHPLAAGALAAWTAFLVHGAIDWDWELTGVTTLALACGALLLVAARREGESRPAGRTRAAGVAAVAVASAAALVGLLGNIALARSGDSARHGDWSSAARWAQRAAQYAPWSSEPQRQLGLAQPTAAAARPHLLAAVRKDPQSWRLWLELAWASTGDAQREALDRARALDPLGPEIRQFESQIGWTRG